MLLTEKLKISSLVNYGNVNDVYLYHYYELSTILLILIGGNAMIVITVVGTHFNAQIEYIPHILWLLQCISVGLSAALMVESDVITFNNPWKFFKMISR